MRYIMPLHYFMRRDIMPKKAELTFDRNSLSLPLKRVVKDNVRWIPSIAEAYPELTGYTLYNNPEHNWTQLIFDKGYNLKWPLPADKDKTPFTENMKKRLETVLAKYMDQISIIEDSNGVRYAIMGTPMDAIVICHIVDDVIKSSSGIHICINCGM